MKAIDLYGGVLVFFFMIAYNTRLAKDEYAAGQSDHLKISIKFLFDMFQFIKDRILTMLTSRRTKK